MYIIVMGTCELVSLVVQQSGASTLRWRGDGGGWVGGLLDDVHSHWTNEEESSTEGSCGDVAGAGIYLSSLLLTLLCRRWSQKKKNDKKIL